MTMKASIRDSKKERLTKSLNLKTAVEYVHQYFLVLHRIFFTFPLRFQELFKEAQTRYVELFWPQKRLSQN